MMDNNTPFTAMEKINLWVRQRAMMVNNTPFTVMAEQTFG